MGKEFSFFIYLLERYAEHLGVTADVAYRRLMDKNLVDYAVGMYELYHVEAIETPSPTWTGACRHKSISNRYFCRPPRLTQAGRF